MLPFATVRANSLKTVLLGRGSGRVGETCPRCGAGTDR